MARTRLSREPPAPPVIKVVDNPFGEFAEEKLAGSPTAPDRFYLKGYSDKRHERELLLKKGEKAPALERRFQYVSIEKQDGTPDKTKYTEWKQRGYRPVMWEEAASLGIEIDDSTAEKDAAGRVRVGTQVLMVTDALTAARHFRDQRDATAAQYDAHVRSRLEDTAENYNVKHGHTPGTGTKFEFDEKVTR